MYLRSDSSVASYFTQEKNIPKMSPQVPWVVLMEQISKAMMAALLARNVIVDYPVVL